MVCVFCSKSNDIRLPKLHRPCEVSQNEPWKCSACTKMAEIEAKIVEAREHIAKAHLGLANLLDQHRELRTQMNRIHNRTLLEMPPEIASYILQLSMPNNTDESQRSLYKNLAHPLTLASVCRDWRQLALATPQLWTVISIRLDSERLSDSVDSIRGWLGRSGGLPLSVHVYDSNTASHLDDIETASQASSALISTIGAINEHSNRWRHLDLRIPAGLLALFTGIGLPASILRSLRLEATDAKSHYAKFRMTKLKPSPTRVFLSHIYYESVTINWSNVTQVEITNISVDRCCEVLKQASRLKYCTFSDVTMRETSGPFSVVVHPYVQNLKFEYPDSEDSELLFTRIAFPALQRLNINMDTYPLPTVSLLGFLRRSSCELRELRIRNASFGDDELIIFLKAAPSVVKIDILPHTGSNHTPDNFFKILSETSLLQEDDIEGEAQGPPPRLLPNLQSFRYIADEKKTFPWDLLAEVSGPVAGLSNPRRRPLQTIEIYFDRADKPHPPPFIEKQFLLPLIALRTAGVDVQVKCNELGVDMMEASIKHHGIELDTSYSTSPARVSSL